jgi:hypothetical protein
LAIFTAHDIDIDRPSQAEMADPAEAEAAAAAADTISGGDIDELVSMGLGRLQDEPARLRSEADTLHQALQTLTLDNYSVFIENQDCVRWVCQINSDSVAPAGSRQSVSPRSLARSLSRGLAANLLLPPSSTGI